MAKRIAKWLTVICVVCCMAMAFVMTGCANDSARVELTSVTIDASGHLIATYSDETTQDLGSVLGQKGDKGDNGAAGTNGTNGVGIKEASVNEKGEFVIVYTDDKEVNLGVIKGADGKDGVDGTNGKDGVDGTNGKDGVGVKAITTITKEGKAYLKIELTEGDPVEVEIPSITATEECDHSLENAQSYVLEPHEDKKLGRILYVWNDCGHSKILVPEHTWDVNKTSKAATCTEEGYKDATVCTVCGAIDAGEVIPALTHNLSETSHYVEVVGAPICTNDGFSIKVCQNTWVDEDGKTVNCDHAEATQVNKLGHQSANWSLETPPTKDTAGIIKGLCVLCGENKTIEVELSKWTADAEAIVCNETATIKYSYTIPAFTAEVGNKTYSTEAQTIEFTQETEKHFHITSKGFEIDDTKEYTWNDEFANKGVKLLVNRDYTCKDVNTNAVFTCERCKQPVGLIVNLPHVRPEDKDFTTTESVTAKPVESIMNKTTLYVKAATCVEDGYEWYLCKVCGKLTETKLDAIGHNYTYSFAQDTDKKWYYTAVCENNRAHTLSKTVVAKFEQPKELQKAATCTEAGKIVYRVYRTQDDVTNNVYKDFEQEVSILPHYIINGETKVFELEDSKIYDWTKELQALGIKALINKPVTCKDGEINAVFNCDGCSEPVGVQIRVPHTAPTEELTELSKSDFEALTWDSITQTGTFDKNKVYTVKNTCTIDGVETAYICTVCGEKQVNIKDYSGHKMVTKTRTDSVSNLTYYWQECSNDDCTEKTAEREVFSVVKTPKLDATCNATGVDVVEIYATQAEFEDKKPTNKYEEVTPMTAHKLNGKLMPEFNDDGAYILYPVPMLGVSVLANSAAPCNSVEGGDGVFTCDYCEGFVGIKVKKAHTEPTAAETVYLDLLPSTKTDMEINKIYVVKATCTTVELKTYLCAYCGERVDPISGTANGHEFEYEVKADATLTTVGSLHITCDDCSYSKNVDISAWNTLPETAVKVVASASCQNVGVTEYTVTITGDDGYTWTKIYTYETHKTGHNTLESVPTYKWTFQDKTYEGKFCKDCGKVIVIKINATSV